MYRGEDPKEHLSKISAQDLDELTKEKVDTFALTSVRLGKISWAKKAKAKVEAKVIQKGVGKNTKQVLLSSDWNLDDIELNLSSALFVVRERQQIWIQIKVKTSSLIPMKLKTIAKTKPFQVYCSVKLFLQFTDL